MQHSSAHAWAAGQSLPQEARCQTPPVDRRYCACQHLAIGIRALPFPPQPCAACPQALPSSQACNTQLPAAASPFHPGAEGKPTTAGKGRWWVKGVAHPHPFPHQLRLTELGPTWAGRVCKTSSLAGSGSETSFAEETGAASPTAKNRISPKTLRVKGTGN